MKNCGEFKSFGFIYRIYRLTYKFFLIKYKNKNKLPIIYQQTYHNLFSKKEKKKNYHDLVCLFINLEKIEPPRLKDVRDWQSGKVVKK